MTDIMKRNDFVAYLKETLIPDLMESGSSATAQDFEACVAFIEGAEEFDFDFEAENE